MTRWRQNSSVREPSERAADAPSAVPDSGFTLVEVLVAVVIFVMVSIATVGVVIQALKTVRANSDRIIAANIARSQVEALRAMGTSQISIGLTEGVDYPGFFTFPVDPSFTIRTTANWADFSQTSSSCASPSLNQRFMRVSVEVSGANLTAPQVVDTVIEPDSVADPASTGAAAILVVDQLGTPVSDVIVAAADSPYPLQGFTLTTGSDGCIFVPGLTSPAATPATLSVSISRPGYVASTPTGTTATMPIQHTAVATQTFHFAAGSTIDFASADHAYPLPTGIPVSWQLNETGASTHTGYQGQPVSGLWPLVTGFTAWAGTCSDADPTGYSSARQPFGFTAGNLTVAEIATAPVFLRGLPVGTDVTARYIGPDGACTPRTFIAGTTDQLGRLTVGMPYGLWEFAAGGQTHGPAGPLTPAGAAGGPVTVNFTLANLDAPEPTPTPTPTPTPLP